MNSKKMNLNRVKIKRLMFDHNALFRDSFKYKIQ